MKSIISTEYSVKEVGFRYKSFTFDSEFTGDLSLLLTCKVGFCLNDDIQAGTCGYGSSSCSSLYTIINQKVIKS